MSLLKEIHEANNVIKAKATILFLIPFWYIAIYLFKHDFYQKQDIILLICMCLVISLSTAIILSFMFHLLGTDFMKQDDKDDSIYFQDTVGSVLILSAWLAVIIFCCYSACHLYRKCIDFYWFFVLSCTPHFIMLIFTLIVAKLSRKKQ